MSERQLPAHSQSDAHYSWRRLAAAEGWRDVDGRSSTSHLINVIYTRVSLTLSPQQY